MSGPYATMLLGDYGADVIKVEDTQTGDETRQWYPPTIDGDSAYYLSINRNKKDIALNLKTPGGLEVFYQLAKECDVLIENFRPGVTKKLKIDYETVSKLVNPRIIYCSISGFGQTGPYRDYPGYDLIVFAMGGLMSFTGESGRPPVRVGVPIADMCAGLYAVTAILAALRYRDGTGRGQQIDVSMHDVQVSLLTHQAMSYFTTGENPRKLGSSHANLFPYQAFEAKDGNYFVLAIGNDKLWREFCDAIGEIDLADNPKYRTNPDRMKNRDELFSILSSRFSQKPAKYWIELAKNSGIPAGPISEVSEVLSDEHVIARNMVTEIRNPRSGKMLRQIGTPVKFSGAKTSVRTAPPGRGENTSEILRRLGYPDKRIKELLDEGAVSGC